MSSPTISESIVVNVSPAFAYAAISDVTRMPMWSPELQQARSQVGVSLEVGDEFGGSNARGFRRWRTVSTVVEATPDKAFVFESHYLKMPIARWAYAIKPTADGCEVTESWTDLREGIVGHVMWTLGLVATGVKDRSSVVSADMRTTLDAIKSDLESK